MSFLTFVAARLGDELIKRLISVGERSSEQKHIRNYGRLLAAHGPAAEEALEAMAASGTRADAARALVVVGEFKQALDTAPLPQVLKAVD